MGLFSKKKQKGERIYFDFASATPIDPTVAVAMEPFYTDQFYNAGGLYAEAVAVKEVIDDVRTSVAHNLAARFQEITFTNGGSEANNLALLGFLRGYDQKKGVPHYIISSIEHASVRALCHELERRGEITLTELPVNEEGIVTPDVLAEALQPGTCLVSIMYVNNEIGTVQPIRDLMKVLRRHRKQYGHNYPYMHTDAIQAVNYLDIRVNQLGVDMMTVSAAKIYGPKAIAALYVRSGTELAPLVIGGGQESGLRAGTEYVAGIVGLGEALQIAIGQQETESQRLRMLRDTTMQELENLTPKLTINGSRTNRSPNNINFSVSGISSELLVIELDAQGILCSAKSACHSDDPDESYVLTALRLAQARPIAEDEGSVRVTFGRSTTKQDCERLVGAVTKILGKYHIR